MASLTGPVTGGLTRSLTGKLSKRPLGPIYFLFGGGAPLQPPTPGETPVPTSQVSLASLLYGEDPSLGRMLSANAGKVSITPITTNGATLIQSGKTVFLGVLCSSAGTAWQVQVRDNPTASAGGNNKGPAVTAAVGDPFNTLLNGKGIICDAGLVIDTTGTTPGSLSVMYY